ncbi:tail fiber assembly protein [Escherichia coli]|uniref:tail fiber assembly protein n=1 Tax=Escherichia coli TaxID=562 RepID=UPI000DD6830D|nr:tail fiber assembly protein [Escherichia coli]EFO4643088.1 tail fiber assembly protein [Escherichia coli]QLE21281.1 tail fiber assembly protein [Escherichia coli]HBH8035603.1 tail fiber assembly protein [Escherichia coli]HCK2537214.1 tail fiber assembly protein [Escherichia coli]
MKELAVVNNGKVSNIILWDGSSSDFFKEVDGEIIEIPEGVKISIDWGYDGEKFSPTPTPEIDKAQLIKTALLEKEGRISAANYTMNSKQWPGKAAIGRLKDGELAKYNVWLDYLDALYAVDVSNAPDIKWPAEPDA